jgi:F0F1-type ATP synthase gamma subunit
MKMVSAAKYSRAERELRNGKGFVQSIQGSKFIKKELSFNLLFFN